MCNPDAQAQINQMIGGPVNPNVPRSIGEARAIYGQPVTAPRSMDPAVAGAQDETAMNYFRNAGRGDQALGGTGQIGDVIMRDVSRSSQRYLDTPEGRAWLQAGGGR